MSKRALIFGINGMDGSHLADILLEKGYEVHGTTRRSSVDNLWRIRHCLDRLVLHRVDLQDSGSIRAAIVAAQPDEVYNEADQDNVGWSTSLTEYSHDITAGGPLRILEALRTMRFYTKFFQPFSSTVFGNTRDKVQNEETPFRPMSPYAVAKVAANYWCDYYRSVHKMFVCGAFFYTHTSERQTGDYLVHKIAKWAVELARVGWNYSPRIALGNTKQDVDIGWAPEYMETAHEMMQLDTPIIAVAGTAHPVSIFGLVRIALEHATGEARSNDQVRDMIKVDDSFWQDDPPSMVALDSELRKHTSCRRGTLADEVVRRLVIHYEKQR